MWSNTPNFMVAPPVATMKLSGIFRLSATRAIPCANASLQRNKGRRSVRRVVDDVAVADGPQLPAKIDPDADDISGAEREHAVASGTNRRKRAARGRPTGGYVRTARRSAGAISGR